jgi:DDE superfamily endonuclease
MNLLKALFFILDMWRPAFCKEEAFIRSKELAIACLCACGRKTITSMAIFLGRGDKVPIADYKFYSERKWNVQQLFHPILLAMIPYIKDGCLRIAVDDTRLPKTGKKIPQARWHRDPMGPPFRTNLIWGLRYLQMSVLLPLYQISENVPTRAIPIRFISAPYVKKPGKKADESEWEHYRQLSKLKNLSTLFVEHITELRKEMDNMGLQNIKLVITVDGSFCNKICMSIDDPRIVLIARCRRSAKLCFPAPEGGRRVYSEQKFSPEAVRKDANIPWEKKLFFYGGQWREIRYKSVSGVLWQNGTKRRPLDLIVLAPMPYVRGGKRNYRDPAYVLVTDPTMSIELAIQGYLDRWQIEYNHRDEKSILGVGEAQVWNELSVEKQPAFHVAAYSALLLANIISYGDKDHPDFGIRPKWRKKPKRNTCRALVGLLRATLLECPEELESMGMTIPMISAILRQAA